MNVFGLFKIGREISKNCLNRAELYYIVEGMNWSIRHDGSAFWLGEYVFWMAPQDEIYKDNWKSDSYMVSCESWRRKDEAYSKS